MSMFTRIFRPVAAPPVAVRETPHLLSESVVPKDFGHKNGTEVTNQQEIVDQVRALTGDAKITLLLNEPSTSWKRLFKARGHGFSIAPGHTAVAYRLPNGQEKVFHVVKMVKGDKENNINVTRELGSMAEYLYGTKTHGNGFHYGANRRNVAAVQFHNATDEQVLALDNYFNGVRGRAEEGNVNFNALPPGLYKAIRALSGNKLPEKGDCAVFGSRGLITVGLLDKGSETMLPKKLLVDAYQQNGGDKSPDVSMVYYKRLEANNVGLDKDPMHKWPTWFLPNASFRGFRDLEQRADVVAEVPRGQMDGVVHGRD